MENTPSKSINDAFADAIAEAEANPLQSFGDYMLSVANEHYMKNGKVIEGYDLIDGVIKAHGPTGCLIVNNFLPLINVSYSNTFR